MLAAAVAVAVAVAFAFAVAAVDTCCSSRQRAPVYFAAEAPPAVAVAFARCYCRYRLIEPYNAF